MRRLLLLTALITLFFSTACDQGNPKGAVYDDVPAQLDTNSRVTFILSDDQGRVTDRTVAEALSNVGNTVILANRPKSLPWETFLVGLKEKIRQLWARGLEAKNISVIGRGGNGLQALVLASLVREGRTRYAVMGACPRPGGPGWKAFIDILELNGPRMEGQALSLYHSDAANSGSCQAIFDKASALEGWETDLSGRADPTVFEHPSPEWIKEVIAWIHE